jgi:hypothetical protein
MGRHFLVFFTILLFITDLYGNSLPADNTIIDEVAGTDTIPDKQLLYNGRIWRNRYSKIVGDEYLFTNEWLDGSVNINDITFKNLPLRYDILNDELITLFNRNTIIQLNKELIKGFTISRENKSLIFENFGTGHSNPILGFGQVLYKGKICLILKERKLIQELAVQNRYDQFYEVNTLYILKDGIFHKINGKKDMLNVLSDKEAQIKNYLRENKIKIRRKDPDSFLPVIVYYDNLKN